jgi:hypothetical protein
MRPGEKYKTLLESPLAENESPTAPAPQLPGGGLCVRAGPASTHTNSTEASGLKGFALTASEKR